ncbi:unnamed protein product [Miscanthus lutarioriparius]|uniref:Uncharacterized protein n=1 Tax=Miscanthus lutarioriparius TaxID=422564 RepID=A0A811RFA3_9POAL|nr:unnamed protein product [Miscanthus lutarioriparius]
MAAAAADGAAAGSRVPDARRAVAGGKPERRWETGRRRRAGMGGGCQAGEAAGDWRAGAAVRRCRSDFFDLALGFLSCSQPQKLSTEHGMTGRDQDSLLLSHLTTRILVCWIEIAQWPPRRQLKHPCTVHGDEESLVVEERVRPPRGTEEANHNAEATQDTALLSRLPSKVQKLHLLRLTVHVSSLKLFCAR